MMGTQLRLWYVTVDLLAKIRKEREAGVKVFYHFNGKPLTMRKYERTL